MSQFFHRMKGGGLLFGGLGDGDGRKQGMKTAIPCDVQGVGLVRNVIDIFPDCEGVRQVKGEREGVALIF